MVSQEHDLRLRSQVCHQALPFPGAHGDALIVVVGNLAQGVEGLAHREEALRRVGDAHDVGIMRVEHALEVVAGPVHRRVDDEAGLVDLAPCVVQVCIAWVKDVSFDVYLHKARSRHLLIANAIRVQQEMLRARNFHRDVVVDRIRPAHLSNPAICSSKLDPQRALHRRELGEVVAANFEGGVMAGERSGHSIEGGAECRPHHLLQGLGIGRMTVSMPLEEQAGLIGRGDVADDRSKTRRHMLCDGLHSLHGQDNERPPRR
mmetsp:Transcript_88286/g.189558  ORF Transcript_88286/g.189558 Transcript_88286/m.189558 type:complete len:261 (+) Transcript_88286:373-1155(+)